MQRPFLVVYDYGMGGLWAYVWAETREEISSRLPVKIVDELPPWLVADEQELPTFAIDGALPEWLQPRAD